MSLPLFSVIIPTYSRPEQLAACLQAIAALDYPRDRFEVIVVDDGSPEPPVDIVESFSGIIDVKLLTQTNAGPAAARNAGAAGARGDYLVFTDDDCLPDSQWLRAYAGQFSITPLSIVGGRTLNALPHNLFSAASQSVIDAVYRYFNMAGQPLFFATNNLAMPAASFRQLAGFNEQFRTSEDRELCDRWTQNGYRMIYAPQAVCHHAHRLNLRSFWGQHFGYGRGAFRFHRERRTRHGSRLEPDLRFYFSLLTSPAVTERGARMLMLTALVCWSQIASTAGFAWEMLQHRASAIFPSRRFEETQIAE
jgi:glycosyltransferase involved in cell wall biosynthesis